MKLPRFTYHRPETVEEALRLLADLGDDSKVLAGGQSLLPVLALRMSMVEHLIDIGRVAGLDRIEETDGGVTIGAGVRHAQAELSPVVAKAAPLVTGAMPYVGHRAIRNRGTVCGSLAHADQAAELPAVATALGAEMIVQGADGERRVAAADFFQGIFTTDLAETELLRAVHFPAWPKQRAGWSIKELSRRHGDFAMVGLAAKVELDEAGAVASAAMAFFGCGGKPQRVDEAEKVLVGQTPSAELYAEAGALVSAALEPADDLHGSSAYRKHVAGVLTKRGLDEAVGRAAA